MNRGAQMAAEIVAQIRIDESVIERLVRSFHAKIMTEEKGEVP